MQVQNLNSQLLVFSASDTEPLDGPDNQRSQSVAMLQGLDAAFPSVFNRSDRPIVVQRCLLVNYGTPITISRLAWSSSNSIMQE